MRLRRVGHAVLRILARLACAACLLAVIGFSADALAEAVHVTAAADPGLPQAQARQQALDRAVVEAVYQEARRLLPVSVSTERLAALRVQLAPHALDYVQSYQEVAATKVPPPPEGPREQEVQKPQPATQDKPGPVELELDVNVQRVALRQALVRLGFFAGPRHPGFFALRLGTGVKAKDAQVLEPASLLLGLTRAQQAVPAAPEVTLEHLPQGYFKAVLRQGPVVLAADAPDLPGLWLEIWAQYFADPRMQPGPGQQRLAVAGFASVDAVQKFLHELSSWDDAVQESSLAGMDLDGAGVSAQFTCRVISQERLDARLRETLADRKLKLVSQNGTGAP